MRDEPARSGSVLALAGGYEFVPPPDDTTNKPPSPELTRALAQAYVRLGYDLVVLAPEEADLLRRDGVDIPDNWVTAGARPDMIRLEKAGLRIGVVVFPTLDPSLTVAPKIMALQVEDRIRRMREQSDVVIGLSLWGGMAEKQFLKQALQTPDVLLGSGPGPGLAGGLFAGQRTFWTRPVNRGKTVSAVGLAELPRTAGSWKWVRERNIHLLHRPLGGDVAADPAMDALFEGFKKPEK